MAATQLCGLASRHLETCVASFAAASEFIFGTLMTLGLGDLFPVTIPGQILSVFFFFKW